FLHISYTLYSLLSSLYSSLFFLNHPAPTEIYTLSLHDALPISQQGPHHARPSWGAGGRDHAPRRGLLHRARRQRQGQRLPVAQRDRKSTRLNSSHVAISYAVFCLKKKKKDKTT